MNSLDTEAALQRCRKLALEWSEGDWQDQWYGHRLMHALAVHKTDGHNTDTEGGEQ